MLYNEFKEECNALGVHSPEEYGHPFTLFRRVDGNIIASVHIEKRDMHDRTYSPWISSMYVLPEYRSSGVAKDLLREALRFTGEGVYMYIPQSEGSWVDSQLEGWVKVEDRTYLGKPVTIYKYSKS